MTNLRERHSYNNYLNQVTAAAQKANLEIESYSPYEEYPDLQSLLIYNKALLSADDCVIHICATHGGEGPAGSEVQLSIIEKHGPTLTASPKGFLLIFALNPFGFHYLRRTSIENIDLNRNTGEGLSPAAISPDFLPLRSLWRSNGIYDQLTGLAKTLWLSASKGFFPVARTFAEGQNLEDRGLFYSGNKKSIEIKALFEKIHPLLVNKKSVFILDVHTGLGKLYEEMLIQCSGNPDLSNSLFNKPVEIPGTRPNSYRGYGVLADRFAIELPTVDFQFIVQEFGVKSSAASFFVLSFENAFHWSNFKKISDRIYLRHPVKDLFFKTFFNTDPKWISWLRNEGRSRFEQSFFGRKLD